MEDINGYVNSILKAYAKPSVQKFTASLIPNVENSLVLGVYAKDVKAVAARLVKEGLEKEFLSSLPHGFLEAYIVHAQLINGVLELSTSLTLLDEFLPYVDNWATCDSLRPKAFVKNKQKVRSYVLDKINSISVYTRRFGIEAVMTYFLGEDFDDELFYAAAYGVKSESEDYYVKMMVAWLLATAVCKNRDQAVSVITSGKLDVEVERLAVKKCAESFRVTDEDKLLLKNYIRSKKV